MQAYTSPFLQLDKLFSFFYILSGILHKIKTQSNFQELVKNQ